MPEKPLLVFDGRCGFCRIWIDYWKQITGSSLDYAPFQDVHDRFPQIPLDQFRQAVKLILPGGEVLSGARAVFAALRYAGVQWPARIYDHLPGFAPGSEAVYRLIAAHRNFFYQVTRFTFGRRIEPLRYGRVEWLFLKALALIYLCAFASLAVQITGLAGARGILPAGHFLTQIRTVFGLRAYWLAPGVFWLGSGDVFLRAVCWTGAVISVILLLGRTERLALVCLYLLYLSLSTIGQNFLSFQWDALLLEAGFLAIFLGTSKWIVFLFRWLLFRLILLSGAVKLTSHDVSWRNLTAMSFHYMTQPLPTPVAWYAYQLPLWFQRATTAMVLFVELVIAFLILGPRMWRRVAALVLLVFQALIFLTGNYAFFNLLTMALCIFLFDDAMLSKWFGTRNRRTYPALAKIVASLILLVSSFELWGMFAPRSEPSNFIVSWVAPLGIVNTYGLFAVMTTERPEIIVQGSNDGRTWLDYEFPFKPGALSRAPRWVAPYQPRLDWQMWFAALSGYRSEPWFVNFMVRLLQNSPDVTGLLAKNPFPASPPKYVRALVFDYSFTDFAQRRQTGDWWKRQPRGVYLRPISLKDVTLEPDAR
jgi:predicted DCC family thiol-disulfide oxidoreductase YuxK